MWNEYSLPVGADGFTVRGHTRPRIPLPRATAKFFLVALVKKKTEFTTVL